MRIVDAKHKISKDELKKMSDRMFGELVKAVVDVEKEIMIVDADLHADQEKNFWIMDQNQNICGESIFIRMKKIIL